MPTFDNTPSEYGFRTRFEPGVYRGTVVSVKEKTTSAGNPAHVLAIELEHNGETMVISDMLPFSSQGKTRMKAARVALGFKDKEGSVEIETDDWLNRSGIFRIALEPEKELRDKKWVPKQGPDVKFYLRITHYMVPESDVSGPDHKEEDGKSDEIPF